MKNIISKGKDKSKKEFENNVVYRIHSNNCPATYVGQTKRKLMTRINEHKTSEDSRQFYMKSKQAINLTLLITIYSIKRKT